MNFRCILLKSPLDTVSVESQRAMATTLPSATSYSTNTKRRSISHTFMPPAKSIYSPPSVHLALINLNFISTTTNRMNTRNHLGMATPHEASLIAANLELLMTGKYSDITIKCGCREWRSHRSIVCKRSTFFGAACDGSFVVRDGNTITLREPAKM